MTAALRSVPRDPAAERARLRAWLAYVAQTAIDWLDALDAEDADREDDEREGGAYE